MSQYFAVQVVTGSEMQVKEIFNKCYFNRFCQFNVEIIIPQNEIIKKYRDKHKLILKPLLPGYILIKCDTMNAELYYALKKIRAVSKIIRTNICCEEIMNLIDTIRPNIRESLISLVQRLAQSKADLKTMFKNMFRRKQVGRVNLVRRKAVIFFSIILHRLN